MAKSKRARAKEQAIALVKRRRREKEGDCERCDKVGKLDGHHIIPVDYEQTAADLDNIVVLCCHCHTLGKDSAHKNPIEFTDWLDDYAPGLKDVLRKRANVVWPKVDWEEKLKWLKDFSAKAIL